MRGAARGYLPVRPFPAAAARQPWRRAQAWEGQVRVSGSCSRSMRQNVSLGWPGATADAPVTLPRRRRRKDGVRRCSRTRPTQKLRHVWDACTIESCRERMAGFPRRRLLISELRRWVAAGAFRCIGFDDRRPSTTRPPWGVWCAATVHVTVADGAAALVARKLAVIKLHACFRSVSLR